MGLCASRAVLHRYRLKEELPSLPADGRRSTGVACSLHRRTAAGSRRSFLPLRDFVSSGSQSPQRYAPSPVAHNTISREHVHLIAGPCAQFAKIRSPVVCVAPTGSFKVVAGAVENDSVGAFVRNTSAFVSTAKAQLGNLQVGTYSPPLACLPPAYHLLTTYILTTYIPLIVRKRYVGGI